MIQENKYLAQLKKIVLDEFKDENVRIVLFGSRARGDFARFSDVDVGIIPLKPLRNQQKLSEVQERVDDSNIPYKVEIVNLLNTRKEFRNQALKSTIVWREN